MSRRPSTLYEQCLQKTARLLKNSYWNPGLPQHQNPFSELPSSIIDTLIIYVTRVSLHGDLLSRYLRLLSTSGRVTRFIIDIDGTRNSKVDVKNDKNLQRIFMDLSTACQALTTIILRVTFGIRCGAFKSIPALNMLLSKAPNLKHFESCLNFDFSALCNSAHLEKLVINFWNRERISNFLKVDGQFKINTCIKHIEEADNYSNIDCDDILAILNYCTELIYIDVDLSEVLVYRHAEELRSGSLTPKYKMRKCRLGKVTGKGPTTKDAVCIAALTCPDLRELDVCIGSGDVISAVSDCRNLATLAVRRMSYQQGHYSEVQPLLEIPEFGRNLKELDLENFREVDFPSIGRCCPNLEVLKVFYQGKCVSLDYCPTSFRKLLLLDLTVRFGDVDADDLVGILSNATNLEVLKIVMAEEVTDEVLDCVLEENSLSNLKDICMYDCSLSLSGMRNLACTATNLRNLKLNYRRDFKGVPDLFREINPQVNVLFLSSGSFVRKSQRLNTSGAIPEIYRV